MWFFVWLLKGFSFMVPFVNIETFSMSKNLSNKVTNLAVSTASSPTFVIAQLKLNPININ